MSDSILYTLALKENKPGWEHLWGKDGEYPKEPLPLEFHKQVQTWIKGYKAACSIHNIRK